jgi:hypothetical protein
MQHMRVSILKIISMKTYSRFRLNRWVSTGMAVAFLAATPLVNGQEGPPFRNLSTRGQVQSGDNVLIGGVIVTGTGSDARRLMFRAVGPSLNVNQVPVQGRLEDPTLSLHGPNGEFLQFRDDWVDAPEPERTEIVESGLQPADPREPALIHPAVPGAYTVIIRGRNAGTGIALVEVFDIDREQVTSPDGNAPPHRLGNISTRGLVGTGDNALIGGAIIGGSPTGLNRRLIVRGIGPSMAVNGVPVQGRLTDPTLEVRGANGEQIATNNDWKSDQQLAIERSGLAPTDDREAAVILTLPGSARFTAILRGNNNSTGIGLVEFYELPDIQ